MRLHNICMQCTNVSIILDTSASLAVRSFFFMVVERIGVRSVVRWFKMHVIDCQVVLFHVTVCHEFSGWHLASQGLRLANRG